MFRKKQIIFSAGDRSASIFYIQEGTVKLTVTSETGNEAVVAVLDGGNFFGENALASGRPRYSSHAVALTNVRAMRIDRDAILRLLDTDVDIRNLVISSLISLVAQLTNNLAHTLLYSSETRLVRGLQSLAKLHRDAQSVPKLSQQDLANMIGVTRQRVNVLIKQLRKSGVLDSAGGLNVQRRIVKAGRNG